MLACLQLRSPASPPSPDEADALLALARDFSPRVEVLQRGLVLVDVDGLERLIGDGDAVAAALCRLARERQLAVSVAVAPTRTAALLLAMAPADVREAPRRRRSAPRGSRAPGEAGRPGYRLVLPGRTAAAVAPLPLSMLAAVWSAEQAACHAAAAEPASASSPERGRSPRSKGRGSGRHYRLAPSPGASPAIDRQAPLAGLLQTWQRWGLRTLGDLAALPPLDLFERLGTSGLAWQAAARGEDARPLVRTSDEEAFAATMALDWPLDTLEPLAFVVSALLEPLCHRLGRAERDAAMLETTLRLVTKEPYVRRLELPAPMRDAKVLRTLILLDLESHPPGAGIDSVTVTLTPAPARVVQHSLLSRSRPAPERVATLTARLIAVLGEGRVGAPALVDSHEPGAFVMHAYDADANPPARGAHEPRPGHGRLPGFVIRRFREPVAVRVERVRGRPVRVTMPPGSSGGGRIVRAAGPWRTAGGWWHAVDPARPGRVWNADEWDVVTSEGTALRLSRDRDAGVWRVEGVLD